MDGIAENGNQQQQQQSSLPLPLANNGGTNVLLSTVQISNFVIRLANTPDATIEGITMLSPPLTLRIISPFFLSDDFLFDNDGGILDDMSN